MQPECCKETYLKFQGIDLDILRKESEHNDEALDCVHFHFALSERGL